MKTYSFHGVIVPERAGLNISISTPLELRSHDTNALKHRGTIVIKNSLIFVVIESFEETDLLSLKNQTEDLVRLLTDTVGYRWGYGYDCELIGAYDEDGNHHLFGVDIPVLSHSSTQRPLTISELFMVVLKSDHLRICLADLREAIRMPIDTGFHCYRAIETLRRHFLPIEAEDDGAPKKKSWEDFKAALNIDRTWISFVQTFSDIRRHGGSRDISDRVRAQLFIHTWQVVDRFVVLIHRGLNRLPEDQFPILQMPTG